MFETSLGQADRSRATYPGPAPLQIPGPEAEARPARILFLGDTAFGENYQIELKAMGGRNVLEDYGYDYSLANFRDTLLAADLVVANLETPITDIPRSPFAGKKRFIHWGDIVRTPACLARHNITTVSLANNHTFDYGAAGFDQTLEVLAAAGFNMFGAGVNLDASARPLLIDAGREKFAVFGAFERRPDYERRYGVYAEKDSGGLCPLDQKPLAAEIAAVKRSEPDTFVIIFPHWGENYRLRTEGQARGAAALADAGADLILGHGAHCVQEIERIGKTWVVYSLGNFVFNSPGRYKRFNAPPVGLVAELIVGGTDSGARLILRLFPILTSNEQTRFQSRFVSESQFRSSLELLKRISRNPDDLVGSSRIDSENGRFCIEFALK
jgi:hypothetical protein